MKEALKWLLWSIKYGNHREDRKNLLKSKVEELQKECDGNLTKKERNTVKEPRKRPNLEEDYVFDKGEYFHHETRHNYKDDLEDYVDYLESQLK